MAERVARLLGAALFGGGGTWDKAFGVAGCLDCPRFQAGVWSVVAQRSVLLMTAHAFVQRLCIGHCALDFLQSMKSRVNADPLHNRGVLCAVFAAVKTSHARLRSATLSCRTQRPNAWVFRAMSRRLCPCLVLALNKDHPWSTSKGGHASQVAAYAAPKRADMAKPYFDLQCRSDWQFRTRTV